MLTIIGISFGWLIKVQLQKSIKCAISKYGQEEDETEQQFESRVTIILQKFSEFMEIKNQFFAYLKIHELGDKVNKIVEQIKEAN